jgi:hypothetical protein
MIRDRRATLSLFSFIDCGNGPVRPAPWGFRSRVSRFTPSHRRSAATPPRGRRRGASSERAPHTSPECERSHLMSAPYARERVIRGKQHRSSSSNKDNAGRSSKFDGHRT